MSNPFEEADGAYKVLRNDEEQHSLWPGHLDVAPGWDVVLDGASRTECLDYIEKNWTDMRPRSLRTAMESGSDARPPR
ncbi:MbtH family protein [Streptomyces sp. NBC_00280]|uniref:MbtH family protein n=1 Tax=Streptomyces sp. NBC_00280 TaxID=2975699 RepID=UPI0032492936